MLAADEKAGAGCSGSCPLQIQRGALDQPVPLTGATSTIVAATAALVRLWQPDLVKRRDFHGQSGRFDGDVPGAGMIAVGMHRANDA
jgi:hypothetical protein